MTRFQGPTGRDSRRQGGDGPLGLVLCGFGLRPRPLAWAIELGRFAADDVAMASLPLFSETASMVRRLQAFHGVALRGDRDRAALKKSSAQFRETIGRRFSSPHSVCRRKKAAHGVCRIHWNSTLYRLVAS